MATFGQLKTEVMNMAGCTDHFKFNAKGAAYVAFWDAMNDEEYKRGYGPDYEKGGTPALRDMELLPQAEYNEWIERFKKIDGSQPIET